jgi:hypothetical protein
MCGSASEGQESATEGIFVEAPLSFFLLEGLLEIGGGELENAGLGPVGEQVEEIAQGDRSAKPGCAARAIVLTATRAFS